MIFQMGEVRQVVRAKTDPIPDNPNRRADIEHVTDMTTASMYPLFKHIADKRQLRLELVTHGRAFLPQDYTNLNLRWLFDVQQVLLYRAAGSPEQSQQYPVDDWATTTELLIRAYYKEFIDRMPITVTDAALDYAIAEFYAQAGDRQTLSFRDAIALIFGSVNKMSPMNIARDMLFAPHAYNSMPHDPTKIGAPSQTSFEPLAERKALAQIGTTAAKFAPPSRYEVEKGFVPVHEQWKADPIPKADAAKGAGALLDYVPFVGVGVGIFRLFFK